MLACPSLSGTVDPNTTNINLIGVPISSDAPEGNVVAYINLYSKLPETYGKPYCPCRPQKDETTICPCSYCHIEIKQHGHCLCGLMWSREKVEEYVYHVKTKTVYETQDDVIYSLKTILHDRLSLLRYNDMVILSIAIRLRTPLATFDKKLRTQAEKTNVKVLPEGRDTTLWMI